jgi:hypothetical protein
VVEDDLSHVLGYTAPKHEMCMLCYVSYLFNYTSMCTEELMCVCT